MSRAFSIVGLGGAIGLLASLSAGCENTASNCELLGISCTGGTGGTGGAATTGGAGGTGGTTATGGTGGTTATDCPESLLSFGDASDQSARTILVGSDGTLTVAGTFGGTLNFDGTELNAPAQGSSSFLLRLGSGFSLGAAVQLDMEIQAAALTSDGSVVVVGYHEPLMSYPVGCDALADPAGLFVGKLNAGPGGFTCEWSDSFPTEAVVASVTVGSDDTIAIGGAYQGTITISTPHSVTGAGAKDFFLAKLTASGNAIWSRAFGTEGDDEGLSVAMDSAGNVVGAGHFQGVLDLNDGNGQLNSGGTTAGVIMMREKEKGGSLWRTAFTVMGGPQHITAIARVTTNNFIIAGDLEGTAALDSVTLSPATKGLFVARIATTEMGLSMLSGQSYSGTDTARIGALSIDGAGRALLTGWFTGDLTFDSDAPLSSGAETQLFASLLNAQDAALLSRALGSGGEARGLGAALSGADAFVVGDFAGTLVASGTSPHTSSGGKDLFIARLCAE